MISKVLFLDFSDLKFGNPRIQNDFMERVTEVVKEKYERTNVYITDDPTIAETLDHGSDVNTVHIHDIPGADLSGDALGMAFPEMNFADIDITDEGFLADNLNGWAERVGTVVAHEAGHFYLPNGHSLDGINLMSPGDITYDSLVNNNGDELTFTDFQEKIINDSINADSFPHLTDAECHFLGIDNPFLGQDINNPENGLLDDHDREDVDDHDSEDMDDNDIEDGNDVDFEIDDIDI